MDMRNIIRDDEDWCANPRDSDPSTSQGQLHPGSGEQQSGFRNITQMTGSWDTWDYPLEDKIRHPDGRALSPEVHLFRSKLNEHCLFRDCQHELEEARCRCSGVYGHRCRKCLEIFCSWPCKDRIPVIHNRHEHVGHEEVPNTFRTEFRGRWRGGHRQGGRRQLHGQRRPM